MSETEAAREVSTREGYEIWASSYDQEINALIILEEMYVKPLLAQHTFGEVLDVACGTGRYALRLARAGAHVTALDQSPAMLAVARRAAEQEHLSLSFLSAGLEDDLPFAAHQFDLVICALALCHVPDFARTVREFARVLRPGGFLLITDFHPASVHYGWRTSFQQEGVKYRLPNMLHTRDTYLEALALPDLALVQALDIPLGALPPGQYPPPLTEEFIHIHRERPFCLLLFAQKQ